MTRIRDLVQTTTISDLTPSTISSVSGPIFLNRGEVKNQAETIEIVKAFQAVHTPTFGAPIVGTFDLVATPGVSINDIVDIVSPSANQTYQLLGATLNNVNPAGTCTGDLILYNGNDWVILTKSGTITAATETPFDLSDQCGPIYFTKDMYLGGVPTAGTAAQMQFKVVFCKVVQ